MAGHGDGAMGSESEWVDGVGLHTGAPVVVRLRRRAGAVTLRTAEAESRIDELAIAPAERATVVSSADGRLCVRTVEHVFAALGGLSIGGGLSLEVSGPEMPLLEAVRGPGAKPSERSACRPRRHGCS